ncbi:MAG: hypothetical protein Q4F67_10470, partial [Propionibacteriaceae bacterium]|nr:hypothetical protein [Propionibacteriaceae bacterium]
MIQTAHEGAKDMTYVTHPRGDASAQLGIPVRGDLRTPSWRERLCSRVTRWQCWWLLHRDDVVILDVETTGLNPRADTILEF